MSEKVEGQLTVQIIEARNLRRHGQSAVRPYCVVEFERAEVVTADGDGENPQWGESFRFDVCRPNGELTVTLWDRSCSSGENDFLGMFKLRPTRAPDRVNEAWFKLIPREWRDRTKGELHLSVCFTEADPQNSVSIADFELLRVLGKGSYGKVMQVRKRDTGRVYAMKILKKGNLVARNEIAHTKAERQVLATVNSPFLTSLKFCFQTAEKIYMALDYIHGGELFFHLQQGGAFDENRARFYVAELALAIGALHAHDIIYRDIKPENVLLDYNGHVVLTDFGLCKSNMSTYATTQTFCGTAEYLAPEVLRGEPYTRSVDWWSLGVLTFEMIAGLPPFYSENTNLMYKKILYADVQFPHDMSAEACDLIARLLNRNPVRRLGGNDDDAAAVRAHPWFASIDWFLLEQKKVQPPFKPNVCSFDDVSNFDPEFTAETPKDSFVSPTNLPSHVQAHFQGFTYTGNSLAPSAAAMESNFHSLPRSLRAGEHLVSMDCS